eukprot:TRINITY_DN3493_c1_g1_i1.p1 TRINITY_DN3493_c1_g1~~TRINITY_DN3493_c1_g1_i1.p1  ORF type:complete len:113 (-),score=20.41 TRINITY_DN3493_c1_g1_i1:223-561(-)
MSSLVDTSVLPEGYNPSSSSSTTSSFPVATKHFGVIIDDTYTEFLLQSFSDRIFIGITQGGKYGTWYSASKDAESLSMDYDAMDPFTIKTLLGKRNASELQVYPRFLIEKMR